MKTSRHLGLRQHGHRFNPAGYKPALVGASTVDKVRTAVEGLGELIDDYEFHYPQELSPRPRRGPRGAGRARDLLRRERPPPRPALRQGCALSPDDATRAEALRLTREAIDLAGETGAQMIIWPGIEGYNPFQTPYADSWARFVDRVGEAATHARTAASSSSSSTRTPSRR